MTLDVVPLQDYQWHRSIQQVIVGDLWLPWIPLAREQREPLPKEQGGLYRIRVQGREPCVYIGETENFKRRLENELGRSLRASTMPNGEHHTAAPGLWYLQHTGADGRVDVSLAPLSGISSAQRKGLESLAIALERRTYQRSPLLSYSRMPEGLVKPPRATVRAPSSRTRNAAAEEAGESVPPVGDLFDQVLQEVLSPNWGGHRWSDWLPVSQLKKEQAQGLYRVRSERGADLVVVGHGVLSHVARLPGTLYCSYVTGDWSRGQRRELLDDLLALYLLTRKELPLIQFRHTRDATALLQNIVPGPLLLLCVLEAARRTVWRLRSGVALTG